MIRLKKLDWAFVLLCIIASILLLYGSNKPFWGQFDWTGAWFGVIGRNFLEISPLQTKLASITVSGTTNPSDWTFYNHYTSFYPLFTALSMAVFGVSEFSIRLVSIVFSLLMLTSFYILCRKFFSPLVGIFGILAIIFTPMFIYYGKLPVHEQMVLFFSITALYFYLSWFKSNSRGDYIKMFVFLGLSFLTSWTGFYILFLISVHLFLTKRWTVLKMWPAFVIVGGIAILHLIHIYISSDIKDFYQALLERSSGGKMAKVELFTPFSFVLKQFKWFIGLYSRPLALLALITLIFQTIKSVFFRKFSLANQICLMFFFWGFFEWLLVPRIAWIHDYMLIYFLPFVTLTVGLVFAKIISLNRILGFAFIFIFMSLSVISSVSFTSALISSKDQTANLYFVANKISKSTNYGDKIIVFGSSSFEKRYPSHYLSFYSDRFVKYSQDKPKEKVLGYKLVIIPEGDNFIFYEQK